MRAKLYLARISMVVVMLLSTRSVFAEDPEPLKKIANLFELIGPYTRPAEAEQQWSQAVGGGCISRPEFDSRVCTSTTAIPGIQQAQLEIDTRNKFVSSFYFQLKDKANRPPLHDIFAALPGLKRPYKRLMGIAGAKIYQSEIPGGVYEVNVGGGVDGYVIQRDMLQRLVRSQPDLKIDCLVPEVSRATAHKLGIRAECKDNRTLTLHFQTMATSDFSESDPSALFKAVVSQLDRLVGKARHDLVWGRIASILGGVLNGSEEDIGDGAEPFLFGTFSVHPIGPGSEGRKSGDVTWTLPVERGE
ncbi:MAG: hypothetical protein ABIQ70_13535 [Dokdonella sp.]